MRALFYSHTISNWVTQRLNCSWCFRLVIFRRVLMHVRWFDAKFMRSVDLFVVFFFSIFMPFSIRSIFKIGATQFSLNVFFFRCVLFLQKIIWFTLIFLHSFFWIQFFEICNCHWFFAPFDCLLSFLSNVFFWFWEIYSHIEYCMLLPFNQVICWIMCDFLEMIA